VRRVIEVTGLGDAIELCETRESAVEAARSEESE
jgi:hypothetical protein